MRALETRPDLVTEAYQAMKGAIMAGDLAPGTYLAQEDLASRLGVSRQPVSHALMLLRHDGLVVERGRKGQMVAPIDPNDILSMYQARGALDALAARLTAERAAERADEFAGIFEPLLAEGQVAMASGNIDQLLAADVAFHRTIYQMSGNSRIEIMTEAAWHHVQRSMRIVLVDSERRRFAWEEHGQIVDAILSGDEERASEAAVNHAEAAGEATYRRLMTTRQETPAEISRA